MAVALLFEPVSMTAEQYGRVIEQLEASGAGSPPGRRFHACFGPAHRLTVFEVWQSMEEFQAFGLTLMPILAKEHIELAPPEPLETHNIIESGEVSALRRRIDALREQAFFRRPVEKLGDRLHHSSESGAVAKVREKIHKAKEVGGGRDE
ncbi:MAG: hypothetical protein QOJ19_2984 [Acidimicrobiia bacterium]|nr:hypothetical protein [Acidimicrobiia bacterium]